MEFYVGLDESMVWGTHTVKVTLQCGRYKRECKCTVTGYRRGFRIIEDILYFLVGSLWPSVTEEDSVTLTLSDAANNKLAIELDDPDDVANYVVAVEIVDFVPE